MSRARAARHARRRLSYGHYKDGRGLYAFCPLCENRIDCERLQDYGDATPDQLHGTLVEHLRFDCEQR